MGKTPKSKNLLPAVCLDMTHPHNTEYPLAGFIPDRAYLLMGEVAVKRDKKVRGIAHFVLFDISSGKMMRGMYHADRFRYVNDHDTFF